LEDGKINMNASNGAQDVLVDYDPQWVEEFNDLRDAYERKLGNLAISVEHIGSTAIPGIKSKPIIDIDIVISGYEGFPEIKQCLKELGYWHNGDQGIQEREVFKRLDSRSPITEVGRVWTPHHLYVCPKDGKELARHLTFRDFLRANPAKCAEYETIKCEIASISDGNRKKYAAIKETRCRDFVEGILAIALKECKVSDGGRS